MRFFIRKEHEPLAPQVDKCVICNKETEYLFSTPIDERRFFVAGVGQLCKECYDAVYSSKVLEASGNKPK